MTLDEKVDRLAEDMAEVKAALKYNDIGLIPTFEQHCIQDREFKQDYYKFKRWVWGIFCFLVGSGVISISIIKVLGG